MRKKLWSLKMLINIFIYMILYDPLVNALETIFVDVGEDAYFSWNAQKTNRESDEPIWILNHQKQNVFWFSKTRVGIAVAYKNRVKSYGNAENGTVNFTLASIKPNDAGIYYSQYTNSDAEGQELVVLDSPDKPLIEEIEKAIVNRTLVLNCTTESNSVSFHTELKMNFEWKVNKEHIPSDGRYTTVGSQMSISKIAIGDTGTTISCLAVESCCNASSHESKNYAIQVQFGPRLLQIYPDFSTYYIEEGKATGNITGTAVCNPPCITHWSKENDSGLTTDGSTFVLYNVSYNNSGIYIFHAVNAIDKATIKLNIIVTDKPPAPYLNASALAIEGKDLILHCNDISNTEVKTKLIFSIVEYNWRTSRKYSQQSERYRIKDSEFVLKNVNRKDDGTTISCRFTTHRGVISTASENYIIRSTYGPKEVLLSTKSNIIRAREGRELDNVTCNAECNPECIFQWYKGDKQRVSEEYVLSLGQVNDANSGDYFCQALNDYGNKTSEKIHIDVLVLALKDSFTCIEHESVQIRCVLDKNRTGMKFLTWVHLKNNVTIRYLNGQNDDFASTLTINDCSYYDIGAYECRVYSTGHIAEQLETAKTSLTVLGPPRFIAANTVVLETSASFSVRFMSYPAIKSAIWHRNAVKLVSNTKLKMSMTLKDSKERIYTKYAKVKVYVVRLDIADLSSKDYGHYILTVRNEIGEKMHSLSLEKNDMKTWILSVSASILGMLLLAVFILIRIRHVKKRRDQEFQAAMQKVRMLVAERNMEKEESLEDVSEFSYNIPFYEEINDLEVQMVSMQIAERNGDNEENDMSSIHTYLVESEYVVEDVEHQDTATTYNDNGLDISEDQNASAEHSPIPDDSNRSSTPYDDFVAIISDESSAEQTYSNSYEDMKAAKPSSYLEIGNTVEDEVNDNTKSLATYEVESVLDDEERPSTSKS